MRAEFHRESLRYQPFQPPAALLNAQRAFAIRHANEISDSIFGIVTNLFSIKPIFTLAIHGDDSRIC
jgi:hypothetical protein